MGRWPSSHARLQCPLGHHLEIIDEQRILSLFATFKIFLFVKINSSIYAHVCICSWRPEEDVGTGVTGSGESPGVSAGNQTVRSLGRATSTLTC